MPRGIMPVMIFAKNRPEERPNVTGFPIKSVTYSPNACFPHVACFSPLFRPVLREDHHRHDSPRHRLHHGGIHGTQAGTARHDRQLPGTAAVRSLGTLEIRGLACPAYSFTGRRVLVAPVDRAVALSLLFSPHFLDLPAVSPNNG